MKVDIYAELGHDQLRSEFLCYTRRAFESLPPLDRPCILDLGCGTGVPTMELARLSDGEITAIDVNAALVDKLNEKIQAAGLADRVKASACSIENVAFPNEHFNVVWAEGLVHIIGFKKSLTSWRWFIKPKGFLVLHDVIGDINNKRVYMQECGYILLQSFEVSGGVWWNKYYQPLEKRIKELRKKYADDKRIQAQLDEEQQGIEAFLSNPDYYGSVFYIMQKTSS